MLFNKSRASKIKEIIMKEKLGLFILLIEAEITNEELATLKDALSKKSKIKCNDYDIHNRFKLYSEIITKENYLHYARLIDMHIGFKKKNNHIEKDNSIQNTKPDNNTYYNNIKKQALELLNDFVYNTNKDTNTVTIFLLNKDEEEYYTTTLNSLRECLTKINKLLSIVHLENFFNGFYYLTNKDKTLYNFVISRKEHDEFVGKVKGVFDVFKRRNIEAKVHYIDDILSKFECYHIPEKKEIAINFDYYESSEPHTKILNICKGWAKMHDISLVILYEKEDSLLKGFSAEAKKSFKKILMEF